MRRGRREEEDAARDAVVRTDEARRLAVLGGRWGAVVGLVAGVILAIVTVLVDGTASPRSLVGLLVVCGGGGATLGAIGILRVELHPLLVWERHRPESRWRLFLLLLAICVLGLGSVAAGAYIGGFADG